MAGKVVAITGANGGLGRAISQFLAAEGETVVLMGRTLSKVQEVAAPLGANAMAVACDVTSPASIRAAFQTIAEKHPKIDVLINNAALFKMFLLEEATDEQIIDTITTNLTGPILCARAAIPMLGSGGHIINISSESVEISFPHLTLYQATKAGLEGFSRHLEQELVDKGIRVTVVRAGAMMGPGMSAEMDPDAITRYHEASLKRGLDMTTRGISQYGSTMQVFRMLIDLPADFHVGTVRMQARPTG